MKAKGSSLYEVLKSASRPPGESAPAPAPPAAPPAAGEGPLTLQERLAAYKARKLAECEQAASPATALATPPPAPAPAVSAEVTPPPAPAISSPAAPRSSTAPGPGERTARLSYNTLVFAALVAVGLLFIAYALGVHSGRSRAPEPALPAAAALPPPAPAPRPEPPPPARQYTIRLAEWPMALPSQRTNAELEAENLRKALERAGHRNVEKTGIRRPGGETRLVLYLDRFPDPAAAAVRQKLASLRSLKVGTRTPFAEAVIEEAPQAPR